MAGKKQGLTYGKSIERTKYSKKLKRMILRCLFECPDNRPTHKKLRELVVEESRSFTKFDVQNGFDFVIDLSERTLKKEAKEREEQEVARERMQRRRAREREEAAELERLSHAKTVEAAKMAVDEDPDDWDFGYGSDTSGEDQKFYDKDGDIGGEWWDAE